MNRDRRLPADKLEGITLAVTRYLRQLEGDAWAPEPTLLGFDYVHAELYGVAPGHVGAVPSVEMPDDGGCPC